MKGVQTSKANAFGNWRIKNTDKFNAFIWLQLNYIKTNAEVIQIIIELKEDLNPVKLACQLKNYLVARGIECFILDFNNKDSEYYVHNLTNLGNNLKLSLSKNFEQNSMVDSYWDYRVFTRPQNCLTTDIDALENFNNTLVTIEAAELFDTSNINESIKHIFKTFKFRKNQVNPEQYLSHYNFAKKVSGKAYILFHETHKHSYELQDMRPCLLIKNNESFYKMLNKILLIDRNDISIFVSLYDDYLKNNLAHFNNIYDVYAHLAKQ